VNLPPMPSLRPAGTVTKASGELGEGDGIERKDNLLLIRALEKWVGDDEKSAKSVYDLVRVKAKEFAGPHPVDPLVASASIHAAVCWFELTHRTGYLPINRFQSPDFRDIAYERAHKRFLESVRTVANLRKLKLYVQINIATNQQVINER
jgi:hypothetical protein